MLKVLGAEHGSLQVINVTPNEGYFFEGWTGSGIADPNSATTIIEMTEDRNITASFSIKKHSLLSSLEKVEISRVRGTTHTDLLHLSLQLQIRVSFSPGGLVMVSQIRIL